jgi:hypothetical protein
MAIVVLEEGQPWKVGIMGLVDQPADVLAGPDQGTATRQLMAAGHSEDEVRGVWNFARVGGYTESTGLGMDRLTMAGKPRAVEIRSGPTDGKERIRTVF